LGPVVRLRHSSLSALWGSCPRPPGGPVDSAGLRHHDLHLPVAGASLRARRGWAMNLLMVGASVHNTPIELRERLAFDGSKLGAALAEINGRYGLEVVILSTCNRVEI